MPERLPIPIQPPVWNNGVVPVVRFVHGGDGSSLPSARAVTAVPGIG